MIIYLSIISIYLSVCLSLEEGKENDRGVVLFKKQSANIILYPVH